MKSADRLLGMNQAITRRDFVNGVFLGVAAGMLPGTARSEQQPGQWAPEKQAGYYPPTLTGLRGSHPGSFEVAHELALQHQRWPSPVPLDEYYDMVVVGGGISGLTAAHEFLRRKGEDSRVLVLDNHDDFGGHAKRNEFHQAGPMRLAWGGAINLEYPNYGQRSLDLLRQLGIDVERMKQHLKFNFSSGAPSLEAGIYFDKDTFGREVTIKGSGIWSEDPRALWLALADQLPINTRSRSSLVRFMSSNEDLLVGMSETDRLHYLRKTSYLDFVTRQGGLTAHAARIFQQVPHGLWGVGIDALSVDQCIWTGLPGQHALGKIPADADVERDHGFVMFPDGNASVARLLVRSMVPGVAPGEDMDDIVTARIDYGRLDVPGASARIRLNSTAVRAENVALKGGRAGVAVTYVRGGRTYQVHGGSCILACYNNIVPHLVPDLPVEQVEALRFAEKVPLIVSNVLLRDGQAIQQAQFGSAHSPGRLHAEAWSVTGIGAGDYPGDWNPEQPAIVQFYGAVAAPEAGAVARDQYRAGRRKLLGMSFEQLEREIRDHLVGLLGSGGLDPARDVQAITVNRWPHGYAYEYVSLSDPDWAPGEAPHEIGRQRHGRIAIANSDAGAFAYLNGAIDQALRAVDELLDD